LLHHIASAASLNRVLKRRRKANRKNSNPKHPMRKGSETTAFLKSDEVCRPLEGQLKYA
jgi:hypothetical protein